MNPVRTYRRFEHKGAAFRICCSAMDAVEEAIVRQRAILERYIERHPEFGSSFLPLEPLSSAPECACRMSAAARLVGVGPMAAVAGTMAQLAVEAGRAAGADEAIIDNGGDIFISSCQPVTVGLFGGQGKGVNRLAFSIEPEELPLAVCSSSGTMGHSTSLGNCDLATVVSKDASLADAAATQAANQVKNTEDMDAVLNTTAAIQGVTGVLIVKGDRVGMAGALPALCRPGA